MIDPVIYVDLCNPMLETQITSTTNISVVRRMEEAAWNVNDAMAIITDPRVELAVINQLDEISLMEISLLNFMCKPILVTHNAIKEYPAVERTIDYTDYTCSLRTSVSNFITWYRWWKGQ